jgi:TOTE conflict system, Archaeo-Eukaryotic Primase domain
LRRIRLHRWRKDRQTVVVEERFPGELEVLRTDNVRLRRLLKLSEEQARPADADQATLTGAPESPVSMRSAPKDKVRFFLDLFCCRSDVYALRWENRRDGRSGWMPAIRGYWRNGMNRADAPYLPLTPDVVGQHLRGEVHTACIRLATMTHVGGSRPPAAYPRDGRRFAATRAVTLADQNDHTPAISACTDAGDPQYAVDRRWMGRPELV